MPMPLAPRLPLPALAVLGLVLATAACDLSIPGAAAADRPGGSDVVSLDEGDAMRIYYQFVDDRGRVRFVESLDQVPLEWRERVGFVESSTPPPMSPQDMRRAIAARYVRPRALAVPDAAPRPRIILYSADWCPACRKAKRYLDSNGIDYDERDVDDPEVAQELARKSGGRSIPVFDIGGAILRGFSEKALTEMIASAS